MRLFEAIIDANHRAVAGDTEAGLHPADFADELPVIALTCIDPRLNAFFPNALALPAEEFIWLRNAGNIITAPLSSTMRSLALACAVKGGKEIEKVVLEFDAGVTRGRVLVGDGVLADAAGGNVDQQRSAEGGETDGDGAVIHLNGGGIAAGFDHEPEGKECGRGIHQIDPAVELRKRDLREAGNPGQP